jgi:hypothetical protein
LEVIMRIGGSLFLLAIGAILAWAVSIDPTPFAGMTIDWVVVGYILMAAGLVGVVWALVVMSNMRDRAVDGRSVTYVDERVPPRDPLV